MKRLAVLSMAIAAVFAQSVAAEDAEPNCVAGPYVVLFDFDNDQISPAGRAVLDNAESTFTACEVAEVVIAGHTDTMGEFNYNIGLSHRFAVSASAYLVSRGIPAGVITVEAFGESRLLIDTQDGVREPQNRRVEITFGPSSGW